MVVVCTTAGCGGVHWWCALLLVVVCTTVGGGVHYFLCTTILAKCLLHACLRSRSISHHHRGITRHHAASRSITRHHAASCGITRHHAASRGIIAVSSCCLLARLGNLGHTTGLSPSSNPTDRLSRFTVARIVSTRQSGTGVGWARSAGRCEVLASHWFADLRSAHLHWFADFTSTFVKSRCVLFLSLPQQSMCAIYICFPCAVSFVLPDRIGECVWVSHLERALYYTKVLVLGQ